MGCVEYWRGLHVDLHPTHAAFAGGRGLHQCVATLATPLWLSRRARLSGKACLEGGVAGLVGWQAWWGGGPGLVAGLVGWLARSGGWQGRVAGLFRWQPGGQRGVDLCNKECTGVNTVT